MTDQPDALDQALGLAIRLRRKAKGLSQQQLGDACDVSFQQIQKYERGSNRVSFSMLVRIAKAMSCHVFDLVAEVEGLGEGIPSATLTQPEAPLVMEAMSQISNKATRWAIVELARALADSEG